ncbi:TlpA family protein disulfide reductase [Leptospira wolffii]|uniref:TlpA family protein disulfide reductase n=1 Tax=Leptospira wolffii TaxID=409998 RepID=A0ABV5BJA8_9LEPT|nr:TlpA disulfide reductase family protein [Leptospira wolffii]EPG64810.1 redoxin [Leptospira wolffii serovar Khorat str. Khorat-H2]TGL49114.1 TlpA family protein disulfide reductase [Leptospira wolffii]
MNKNLRTTLQYSGALALLLAATFFLAWFRALDTQPVLSLDGKDFRSPIGAKADIKGKTTVVYFWATWCEVCNTNLPLVNWYASFLKDKKGFAFISVEEGDNAVALKDYLDKQTVEFPILLGNPMLLRDWSVRGYPTFYILDGNGKVRFAEAGIMSPFGIFLRLFWARIFWP